MATVGKMLTNSPRNELLKKQVECSADSYCTGLCLSARWSVAASFTDKRLNFIILPDRDSAEYCASDLYGMLEGDRVFFLPSSASNVHKSNFKDTSGVQRTSAIDLVARYASDQPAFIVTYPEAVEEGIPPSVRSGAPLLHIEKGMEIKHSELFNILTEAGFEKVDFVSGPGQFALRGGIADIFSFGFNFPYRFSFFGDEIDAIHVFDANSQLSTGNVTEVDILADLSAVTGSADKISIFDILPGGSLIWLDSSDLYKDRPFFTETARFKRVFLQLPLDGRIGEARDGGQAVKFNIVPQPVFNKNFELLCEDIRRRYLEGYRVYVYTEKISQAERLRAIFEENGALMPEMVQGKSIHEGFIDNDGKTCHYSDHEIFDKFHRAVLRRSVDKTEQLTVNDLSAFNVGDYVVHIDMGVGIYGGLVKMTDGKGRTHEVVKLQYRDGDMVFISVHSLHKISKYRSKDGETPRIDKLGSKSWQTLKTRAKGKVKDIAKELIQLYAKRKASEGYAFSSDTSLQTELESSFEWEDTPDQEKATEAIKRDMEDRCPMDRLICGDVGFGKTELAVRAAFKAALDGKQVAVLVPTTILCLQHYNTFKSRLENFACSVEYVSRLKTARQVEDIRKRLENGQIDIIIGTHKIIGKDFKFKDLGLLIIDEEQKFGVSAKERLRQLKTSVDTLTLTATPIPRTLQFSLLGARDLSIISTPPPNRVPVQTEIMPFDKNEIKSIIRYELKRGGQVFFIHNRVEELPGIYEILHRLMPDITICVAHGQMEAGALEDKILDFIAGEYDVLLCTTIIENGMDIPNANTIIINQAQNFGLSDLHQLRGRVGRSKNKGFCYLIVPPLASISDDARKRLNAIEAFSDLGSGFNIAMQDLDIRGAGNLLGAQQSGFIADMGMETYQKILEEAMGELGIDISGSLSGPASGNFVTDCTIDTDFPAMIPDGYIDIPMEKIRIYKELDSTVSDKALNNLRDGLADRFGTIPSELDALLDIVRIRTRGRTLGFEKIIIKNGIMICFFISNPMSPFFRSKTFDSIIGCLNANPGVFELKQKDSSLRLVARNVNSLPKALANLSLLASAA